MMKSEYIGKVCRHRSLQESWVGHHLRLPEKKKSNYIPWLSFVAERALQKSTDKLDPRNHALRYKLKYIQIFT